MGGPLIEVIRELSDGGHVLINLMNVTSIEPDAESRVTVNMKGEDQGLNFKYPGGYSAFRDMLERNGLLTKAN